MTGLVVDRDCAMVKRGGRDDRSRASRRSRMATATVARSGRRERDVPSVETRRRVAEPRASRGATMRLEESASPGQQTEKESPAVGFRSQAALGARLRRLRAGAASALATRGRPLFGALAPLTSSSMWTAHRSFCRLWFLLLMPTVSAGVFPHTSHTVTTISATIPPSSLMSANHTGGGSAGHTRGPPLKETAWRSADRRSRAACRRCPSRAVPVPSSTCPGRTGHYERTRDPAGLTLPPVAPAPPLGPSRCGLEEFVEVRSKCPGACAADDSTSRFRPVLVKDPGRPVRGTMSPSSHYCIRSTCSLWSMFCDVHGWTLFRQSATSFASTRWCQVFQKSAWIV